MHEHLRNSVPPARAVHAPSEPEADSAVRADAAPHERRRRRAPIDARRYRTELAAIIREVLAAQAARGGERTGAPLPAERLDAILRRHPRDGRGFFSRSDLIEGYRVLAAEEGLPADEATFVRAVRRKRVRTLSGVAPVTVFTRPFPCPGRCVYCPNDVRMPKSYLAAEPGAQRAADNGFDPYLQTWNRLAAFRALGHATDKVELIVLGGTWSAYPDAYRRWFVKRLFDALDDFGAGRDGRASVRANGGDAAAPAARLRGRDVDSRAYNRAVGGWLRREHAGRLEPEHERASWSELEAAQRRNETSAARCVGLVFETRPDCVTAAEVEHLRRLGATKVQLGVQSLDDGVLSANARGHDVACTRRAFALLRAAGFKIHAHWMPNLLGATPASDVCDFARLFDDADFRPDELKVYPCSLVESAELVHHHQRGAWRPYAHEELLDVVVAALEGAPRWCRLTRVIRDIASDDIVVGNRLANFREIAERELAKRGGRPRDIRARELRGRAVATDALRLVETRYATSTGEECFLELVGQDDALAGFLRLHLPSRIAGADGAAASPAELAGAAVVRELHVYGEVAPLGARGARAAQHRGIGARLLEHAAERALAAGHGDLAVISAVGTRAYYRARGFRDGAMYQHRALRERG